MQLLHLTVINESRMAGKKESVKISR